MAQVKAICPNCGEQIEIDSHEFNVVCRFCGVPFMPREGIDLYERHIGQMVSRLDVDTVNVRADDISNYATLGLASLKDGNHEKCGFYAEDILKRQPNSPEGLLLKAFFVSNNYSKEEGIRTYFTAFENAESEDLKTLILETFKKEFEDYSLENFSYFFQELDRRYRKEYHDLLMYSLTFVSCEDDHLPLLGELEITEAYLKNKVEIPTERLLQDEKIGVAEDRIIGVDQGKIVSVIYLPVIDREIEKYTKKNDKKCSYCFYLGNRTVSLFFEREELALEEFLKEKKFHLNEIRSGCYVATCVYGSYNAREVWVLRRFRDDFLARSLAGRAFIRFYYAVSPTLVRRFGNRPWFVSSNKKVLDRFVRRLKRRGYEDTPYRDRY